MRVGSGGGRVSARGKVERSAQCRLRCALPLRDAQNRIEGGDQRFMDMQGALRSDGAAVVLLGDSSGRLLLYALARDSFDLVCERCVPAHATPVLCVELCEAQGQLFGLAGTAAGDLMVFHVETLRSAEKPADAIHVVKGVHAMGINDISVAVRDSKVFCVSVGDDQSLRICKFAIEGKELVFLDKVSYMGVSGTSIRSCRWVESGVYFVGWEQSIQKRVWVNEGLVKSGWADVQVPETSCIDLWEGAEYGLGAVCGAMGIEVFEYSI